YQVSRSGATQPLWRRDGKELFFLTLDGMLMAAPVIQSTPGFEAGTPEPLFQSGTLSGGRRTYAVTKDGQRFLVLVPRSSDRNATSLPITVVTNWPASVQK